jgi:hypothetical protein
MRASTDCSHGKLVAVTRVDANQITAARVSTTCSAVQPGNGRGVGGGLAAVCCHTQVLAMPETSSQSLRRHHRGCHHRGCHHRGCHHRILGRHPWCHDGYRSVGDQLWVWLDDSAKIWCWSALVGADGYGDKPGRRAAGAGHPLSWPAEVRTFSSVDGLALRRCRW